MPRRKTPEPKVLETQDIPASAIEKGDPDLLTTVIEQHAQLRRLLKAENDEFSGLLGRMTLRNIAEDIRSELRGSKEVDMGDVENGV